MVQGLTGAMAQRFQEFDWADTPIGAPEHWPTSWRKAVEICLASGFPTALALGPELIYFYNDAFIPIGGSARHPHAIGLPVREVWREIWGPVLESRFRETLSTGLPTGAQNLLLPLMRSGYPEETYMTFSFAALRADDGTPNGIFCTATENTALVLAQRQLECLRRLAADCVSAESPEEACRLAAGVLDKQTRDVPFALFYLVRDGKMEVAATAGLSSLPESLHGGETASEHNPWQLPATTSGRPALIENAGTLIASSLRKHDPSYPPPRDVLVLPVGSAGSAAPSCVMVAGLNPMRPTCESRAFHELIVAQFEKAIDSARMRQHAERRTRELATLDRAKTVFFSNVSHELRTPLTLLLGPIRQLLDRPLAPQDRELLEIARRAGGRLLKLVNSLLEFSRVEAGRIDARFAPTDLAQLTAELAGMFRSRFELAKVALHIGCPELPDHAYVDRDMWERIVLNLLSNALKFTMEGRVSLKLGLRDDHFELEVIDTGCGIPAADLPHIFERFAPRSARRARTVEGAGIGLSLVQELVRLHGGTLAVSSELDRGTTVTVRIPKGSAHLPREFVGSARAPQSTEGVARPFLDEALDWLTGTETSAAVQPESSRPQGAEPHEARSARERILVVDDNAEMRRYLSRILSERWDVQTAPDGLAAMELIGQHPPDLVVSDIMMPRMDGLEMLRALRASPKTTELPVLLLSARAGEADSTPGLQAGADDYLIKPFSRRELTARIEARLAKVRQHAAERSAREQAERDLRARDDFFAALSHELRTPVMALTGLLASSRAERPSRSRHTKTIDAMELATRSIQRLAEDLHDVARSASGQLRVEFREFASLAPLIEAATESISPDLQAKQLALRTRLARGCGPVQLDPQRLHQIVSNLLSNAVRYTPSGGWIEVTCARRGDVVEICVRDSGRGITAEALPHVFEQYWRGDAVREDDSGLGLGLAIVQRLVKLHGGRIEAMSRGEGQGATFTVQLPVSGTSLPH